MCTSHNADLPHAPQAAYIRADDLLRPALLGLISAANTHMVDSCAPGSASYTAAFERLEMWYHDKPLDALVMAVRDCCPCSWALMAFAWGDFWGSSAAAAWHTFHPIARLRAQSCQSPLHLPCLQALPGVGEDRAHEALAAAVETVEADPDFQLNPDGSLDGRAAARWEHLVLVLSKSRCTLLSACRHPHTTCLPAGCCTTA